MARIIARLVLRHLQLVEKKEAGEGVQLAAIPWNARRCLSTDTDFADQVDILNEMFVEARDEIDYAKEDAETVYFNESAQEAREAVGRVLGKWERLLQQMPDDERMKLQRSMGLKMEQLKAELKQLDNMHA